MPLAPHDQHVLAAAIGGNKVIIHVTEDTLGASRREPSIWNSHQPRGLKSGAKPGNLAIAPIYGQSKPNRWLVPHPSTCRPGEVNASFNFSLAVASHPPQLFVSIGGRDAIHAAPCFFGASASSATRSPPAPPRQSFLRAQRNGAFPDSPSPQRVPGSCHASTHASTVPDSPPAPPPRQRSNPAPPHQRRSKVCPCGQHPCGQHLAHPLLRN